MKEMNCVCCQRPLIIPEGAQALECPACLTINPVPAQQTVHKPCSRWERMCQREFIIFFTNRS